jgi:hypothetical protein
VRLATAFGSLKNLSSNRFAQRIPAVVEVGALQNEENTRYCGSRLTCTTDSGIFASAGMNRK